MQRIAIQGYEGSFHQEAAIHFFGKDITVIPCDTFRETISTAADKHLSDAGIIAIENSIAGSILPNYNLLKKSKLFINGEIYLRIKQQLLVNYGVSLEDIKEVHSHPIALLQCMDYLEQRKWKLVETEDTALSAKHLKQHHSRHISVIAGKIAAHLYDLDILVPNVHTLKNNFTRFLIIKRDDSEPAEDVNKSSLYFHTDHSRGSLARVLTKIAEGGINLSKLQSFPIPGSDWQYSFYVDMEFESLNQFYNTIESIKSITSELRIFGIYKKGETIK